MEIPNRQVEILGTTSDELREFMVGSLYFHFYISYYVKGSVILYEVEVVNDIFSLCTLFGISTS